jgi:hypothetical protein
MSSKKTNKVQALIQRVDMLEQGILGVASQANTNLRSLGERISIVELWIETTIRLLNDTGITPDVAREKFQEVVDEHRAATEEAEAAQQPSPEAEPETVPPETGPGWEEGG